MLLQQCLPARRLTLDTEKSLHSCGEETSSVSTNVSSNGDLAFAANKGKGGKFKSGGSRDRTSQISAPSLK
jgi:hypothetical protein